MFFLAALALAFAGCASISLRRSPPPPGRTTFAAPLIQLPAQAIGNYLVIEAKWDRNGPYRFLVDTGSSVTLMSPALVRRYPGSYAPPAGAPRVRVAAADGSITELQPGSLKTLQLGEARFEEVPVLLYEPAALSAHLGVHIDGILGFPLFREALLTLDYPHRRVLLQPASSNALAPGTVVAFDDARKTPVIPLHLGDRSVLALVDSGSDAGFSLNPAGLDLAFAQPPRTGGMVGTISGDQPQRVARLATSITVGEQAFAEPVVELSDELSAIGGGVLKFFAVTFDQQRDRMLLQRAAREPIRMAPRRSAGVSFSKAAAYWRVAGVVPDSPAAAAGVQPGDLVTRINGEPVAKWDLRRFEQLVADADAIGFSFLNGNTETEKRIGVFALVP